MNTPSLLEQYCNAMRYGSPDTCIHIEQKTGLFGYPPELVTLGLAAIRDGKDPHEAIDAYVEGEQP